MADTTDTTSADRDHPVDDAPTRVTGPGDDGTGPGAPRPERDRPAWRRLAVDAAVLFGLAGVAVTQPLLDLFGNNPTFFVAGNYGRRKTVAFALVIALVPGVVAFLASAPVRLAGERAGAIAHRVVVGVLAALFGLVLCRTLGIDAMVPALALAVAVGVGVAWAEARWAPARRFLAYLAVGNVAFLVLFLFTSPTAELMRGTVSSDGGSVQFSDLRGPVTVLVLDEFPLAAVLRPDGTINEELYPNIATLAGESTWFRNASAEVPTTYLSVPEILTGVHADRDALPTYQDHPRNLFTLFGTRYPVNAYQVVTDVCPPESCGRPEGSPLRQALSDAGVVYRHRILPESLRDGLPPIDGAWGSFGGDIGGDEDAAAAPPATTPSGELDPMARMEDVPREDGARVGQAGALVRQAQLVTSEPSVNLVHVLLPHHPYELTPWGVSSTDKYVPSVMPEEGEPRYERAYAELYAMQAMQVAEVDRMIGEIVAHLKAVGAWDTGTFVLTSDHGIDVTPGNFTREMSSDNEDGILRVPLFIRQPGQAAGEVRDEPATTIDVLPSLIDLLGVETDWELDGHSLFDGSEPGYDRTLSSDTFEDGLGYVERQQAHLPDEGDGWSRVLAIGENGDLVGTPVSAYDVGGESELTWEYDHADLLESPLPDGSVAPVQMRGRVEGGAGEPPDLVVALDGVISGTIGGYTDTDEGWAFTGVLGPEVEGGAREVVAYEVERAGGTVTLHPVGR